MKKGFTLIELLVVIAIIGILASIVLVSLSGARDRARDARAIADMGQLRTTAQLYWDSTGSYLDLDTDPSYARLNTDINAQSGNTLTTNITAITGDEYCSWVQLNDKTPQDYYCISSNLEGLRTEILPSGTDLCTAPTFVCPAS